MYRKLLIYFFLVASGCYAQDGDLDPTFGGGTGKVTVDLGGTNDQAFGVALQVDGKIVVVGRSDADWAVVRLTVGGALDSTFGGGAGFVLTNFGGTDEQARGVAIQTDGKIVVAGYANIGTGSTNDFALARYNTNGSLDTTFGTGGRVNTNFSGSSQDQAFAVALQADGKIVLAGVSNSVGAINRFALARYNTNGALDTTFGTGGLVTTDASAAGSASNATSILIQPDAKIVVGGEALVGGNSQFAVARYNTNGVLDTTFGTSGIVRTNLSGGSDAVRGVARQTDGKIVADGDIASPLSFAVARYTAAGVLDTTTFNSPTGFRTTVVGTASVAGGVALQSNGKIILAGVAVAPTDRFGVVRYTTAGLLDTAFGVGGSVTTAFSGGTSTGNAVVIQPEDQKIVVAGYFSPGEGGTQFAIVRYLGADPCKILIGSDSTLQLFTTQQLASQSGRFAKLAFLQGGFALCGNATFDSCLPTVGSICLECFTLTLQKDIIMNNSSYFGSVGDIIGNGHVIEFAQSVTTLPTYLCTNTYIRPPATCPNVEWGNLVVCLNSDIVLKDTVITFTGASTLDGQGSTLTLDNSSLAVGANGSLLLRNLTINNVHTNNVRCVNAASLLSLEDVQWILDNDYSFTIGRFTVIGDFSLMGENKTFFYQSNQVSTIDTYGVMKIGNKVTFKYDPSLSLQNLLSLLANSSQIILYGGILRAANVGMTLLKGILKINRCSTLFSEGSNSAQGISLGDGVSSSNNLIVQITPAAQLVIEGPVIYNEV